MTAAPAHSALVVDDDPDICEVIQTILELHGYRVLTARDGADALAQLRAGVRPSVIILDLIMPRMNGMQFRDEQTRDPALRTIPVVVLTGDGRVAAKAATLGVEGLRKPVELHVLLDTVGRACRASNGAA